MNTRERLPVASIYHRYSAGFRLLMHLLRCWDRVRDFLHAPLAYSLSLIALIGWGTATLLLVFGVSMVGMMLGPEVLALGAMFAFTFGLTGYLLFAPENRK
jgi:hypothetical protein